MTREVIASMIHWYDIVWVIGLLNPFMAGPQLLKIWRTRGTNGISMGFLILLGFLQAMFSVHGFFIRDPMVMWSNGLAAMSTVAVVLSVLHLRNLAT